MYISALIGDDLAQRAMIRELFRAFAELHPSGAKVFLERSRENCRKTVEAANIDDLPPEADGEVRSSAFFRIDDMFNGFQLLDDAS